MSENKPVQVLHQEHLDWLHDLNFFQDEIKFYQNKLLQIIYRNFQEVNRDTAEEYRQIFLRKLKKIDDLRHTIYEHEMKMAASAHQGEEISTSDHELIRNKMDDFESSFNEMRKTFKSFVAHHMS